MVQWLVVYGILVVCVAYIVWRVWISFSCSREGGACRGCPYARRCETCRKQ